MKNLTTVVLTLIVLSGSLQVAAAEDLNGVRGKIFNVSKIGKSFELLKETVYDPKTNEGKSRHTIYWTEQTKFTKVVTQVNFKAIEGPFIAKFYHLDEKNSKAAAEGKPFMTRYADVLPESKRASGLSADGKSFIGWFTLDEKSKRLRGGTVKAGGKEIKVSLRRGNSKVYIRTTANAEDICKGFWETTIFGKETGGKFVVDSMDIYPLVDPRTFDDPKLPRVLVIGDSISMNYHQSAKDALKGKANYYRCEGNGGPSDRGVLSAELWLGDYTKKGLHWDVIQFNHGLHDLKQVYDKTNDSWGDHQVSIEDYKKNLEKEIQILKKTGAKLMWCSTTPVPTSSTGTYARRKGEAVVFNKAAMEVVSKYPEIQINDLYKFIDESKDFDNWRKGTDVHFWSRDLQVLVGAAVADAVSKALPADSVCAKEYHVSITDLDQSRKIVSVFNSEFTAPPKRTPFRSSVDGPLLGNGDMGVAIGGNAEKQQFILCKNDMWRLQHGYGNSSPVPFGTLNISIPGLKDASYKITQDLYKAMTIGEFKLEGSEVRMECFAAAEENIFVLNLTANGIPFSVNMFLDVAKGRGSDSTSSGDGNLFWGKRAFTKDVDVTSGVAAAWKLLDVKNSASMGVKPGASFVLTPGQTVTLVLAMNSIFDNKNYEDSVKKLTKSIDKKRLVEIRAAHEKWWADYYGKSYVSINDPVIEKQYYLSLYGMGSCSRNPNFPPAIFGWTTTDRPNWLGDYHLNYNHMAPFYGMARANRLEQADPHDTPILEFMDRAKWHCKEIFGFEGVMYPVGIGPKGIESTYGNATYIKRGTGSAENKGLFFGQRTNAAYALVNMAPRWYTTYDRDYGKKIYPFVLQTATFWENYVSWDESNKRFIIEKDSVHEGSGQDMNSCLSLGLVRNALLLALDMSKELNVDADRREKWNHILKYLSGYTYQERDGKKVFRYTEKGTAWWPDNTLGIQQIYPAGQIHLDSDPELLAVSKNTIEVMGRWLDTNGSNSIFPAAVRIGYDPSIILAEMRKYCEHTRPNGFQAGNPHGIENLSTVPNTINEMLCMGHKGVLRLFPAWPKDKDASFSNLRCWGAFVVSGEIKNGVIKNVKIVSEKGRDCTMVNPWPENSIRLIRSGKRSETLSGERVTFKTTANEVIELIMNG